MKSLFGLKDSELKGETYFGIKPYKDELQPDYDNLDKEIKLKDDLEWGEDEHFQNLLRKADIWSDYLIDGLTIVEAEFKIYEQDQRVDILYLDNNGLLIPCELKVSGDKKDTHGQLIRYMSDICSANTNMDFVKAKFEQFLQKFSEKEIRKLHEKKLNEFIKTHKITKISTSPFRGIIIDNGFRPQLKKAVEHLNNKCNFDITLIKVTAKVNNSWAKSADEYLFRLDFSQIN